MGDEVAVCRRGTGRGARDAQKPSQWLGPGIIFDSVRGNCVMAMPGSVVAAHRSVEEKAADRVVVRDIPEQDWLDGDPERDEETTEKRQ